MPQATEFRELDDEELESRLAEYRREVLNLRFQLATGQLTNSSRLGQVRRDVARVLTELRVRDITVAEADQAAAAHAVAAASTVPARVTVAPDVDDFEGDDEPEFEPELEGQTGAVSDEIDDAGDDVDEDQDVVDDDEESD